MIRLNYNFFSRKSIKEKERSKAGRGGKRKRVSRWKAFKMQVAMVSSNNKILNTPHSGLVPLTDVVLSLILLSKSPGS